MLVLSNPFTLFVLLIGIISCDATDRPNIVFILTDDQDVYLGGLTPMVKSKAFFSKYGVIFENAFTTNPICCPSRASILTGKYQHHHHVLNNSLSGNCYGERWKNEQEGNTFATYLQQWNYTTFFAGKYMNQYGVPASKEAHRVPPGWNHWNGLVGNSVYYNYTLSVNGQIELHGSDPEDYLTDLIHERAVRFLTTQDASQVPFFMMLSTPSCHAPFTPSNKYVNAYSNITAPRTPNYNISGGPGKHWLLRQAPSHLSDATVKKIDEIYGKRWATLLSVDDMVQNLVEVLRDQRMLENTFIFLTSDNGFHFGQFSLPWDKRQMYEFDIRIPLLVYGPGVTAGSVRKEAIVTIDFAPTFLHLAGMSVPSDMDGSSLLGLLQNDSNTAWRNAFLIEYTGEGSIHPIADCPQYTDGGVANCFPDCICEDARNNTYTCVRTLTLNESIIYCRFQDSEYFTEMYDLIRDPHQMNNIAGDILNNNINQDFHDSLWDMDSQIMFAVQ